MNSIPSHYRKKEHYLMTAMDRATCCIVGWRIEPTRVIEIPSVVDQAIHYSKCLNTLRRAVELFVAALNRPQLFQ